MGSECGEQWEDEKRQWRLEVQKTVSTVGKSAPLPSPQCSPLPSRAGGSSWSCSGSPREGGHSGPALTESRPPGLGLPGSAKISYQANRNTIFVSKTSAECLEESNESIKFMITSGCIPIPLFLVRLTGIRGSCFLFCTWFPPGSWEQVVYRLTVGAVGVLGTMGIICTTGH